ncbi:RHS repeat-associated core domain-containing protein [Streptomyces sp. NPDC004288]
MERPGPPELDHHRGHRPDPDPHRHGQHPQAQFARTAFHHTALDYAGAYLDSTGLYKMGARYYDPHLGRFTEPDPSGPETNPYLYAASDPINHTTPPACSVSETSPVSGTGQVSLMTP